MRDNSTTLLPPPPKRKQFFEKLVASNSKLAATNEELLAVVNFLTNNNKDLQLETNCLKKRGGSGEKDGKRDTTLLPHFKREGYHEPDACFEMANNKNKRPLGWESWL